MKLGAFMIEMRRNTTQTWIRRCNILIFFPMISEKHLKFQSNRKYLKDLKMKMSERKLQTLIIIIKNGEIENLNYACQIYAYQGNIQFRKLHYAI